MKNYKMMFFFAFLLPFTANIYASPLFRPIPFTFEHYDYNDLDWVDRVDDNNTSSTPLGFSVNIGGATYTCFDLDSNGYIELLIDSDDIPVNHSYGCIQDLIDADSNATYLLAGYNDLTSEYYGYYGYKLFSDRAVFYYDTQTYCDLDLGYNSLNNFQIILYADGNIQWNFNYTEFVCADCGLFTGLYLGNTKSLLTLMRGLAQNQSYLYNNCQSLLTADLDYNCSVDLKDFAIFANQWLIAP